MRSRADNGTIIALGEICFSPTLPCGVIHVQGGEVFLRLNYDMKESAMLVVSFGSVKFQQLEGFQDEKLIFLPTQIYHLGNWQVLRNIYKENQTPSFFETERLRACLHGGGGPQVGEVKYGGSPHLSCKRDQIKMRDYMDRRVTPPKRVTSPTWGLPPPCKQALSII